MLKVVIVEDDFHIRTYLKKNIDWEKHGFQIVGEAPDGVRGLGMICELMPDIVITDIVMPQMDGVRMLEELKKKGIPVKAVVLSSYDDFEYVRESMKLGAVDYILKHNINLDSVVKLLVMIKELINKENVKSLELNKAMAIYRNSSEDIKASFVNDMISGRLTDKKIILDKLSLLNVNLSLQNIAVLCINISDLQGSPIYKTDEDIMLFKFAAINVLKEIAEDGYRALASSLSHVKYIVIMSFENLNNMALIERAMTDVSMKIIECCKQYLKVTATIGISNIHKDLTEIKKCYEEADYALKYRIFNRTGKRIYYREVSSRFADMNIEEVLSSFVDNLEHKNYKKCKEILLICKNELPVRSVSFEKYISTVRSIISQISRHLSKNNIEFFTIFGSESVPYDEVGKFQDVDSMIDWILKIIDRIRLENENSSQPYRSEIRKAIEYIHENYSKNISLNDTAEHSEISYAYLSQMFKQKVGKNFIDYLNEIRVEHAKKLLDETTLKVYEVAHSIGFEDANYFIRVFKNVTGLTPKEYKLRERNS